MDRDRLVLLAWTLLLTAAIVAVGTWDGGVLATPALTDAHAWSHWFTVTDPATTGFALLRLLVLAVAWYLTGVTALGVLTRLVRMRQLIRLADAVTVPALRQLLQAAVGVGVATAVVGVVTTPPLPALASAAHTSGGESASATADAPLWDPVPETATVVVPPALDADSLAPPALDTGRYEPPALDTAPPRPPVLGDTALPRPGTEPTGPGRNGTEPDPHRLETWVVQPGEHFWSIAEAQLAAVTSDAPTDAQVAAYWHRLIAANRSVLAIADEPDLLFPDQVLSLPPVEPGPR